MREVWEYIKAHLNVFIGASVGLTVGILMLIIGFWPTLLLGITTGLGALLIGLPEQRRTVWAWIISVCKRIFKGKQD